MKMMLAENIRAFRKEADEQARFDAQNDALTRLNEFVGKISAAMNPVTYLILNAALIVLLLISAFFLLRHTGYYAGIKGLLS